MNSLRERRYVLEIEKDLGNLNGSEFEELGYIIGEHYLKERLQTRGVSEKGHPVGYTLDAYSDDLTECIECSVEKDYFKDFSKEGAGQNTKIENDLYHVLKKADNVEKILLFSNQPCSPKQSINLCNYIGKIEKDGNNRFKVEWFDNRKLAKYIINEMLKDKGYADRIKEYLPSLMALISLQDNNSMMPSLPDNYISLSDIHTLKECCMNNKCIYIYGISGIGKSLLAIELARALEDKFASLYYIDGATINSVNDLGAIDFIGTDGKINVLGNIKRSETLMLIDDLKSDCENIVQKLKEHCHPDSRIIITSQISLKDKSFSCEMDFPSEEQSRYILEKGAGECPTKVLATIKRTTNYHPLLLSLINQMVIEEGEWDFIENELSHCADFETNKAETVCEQLLRHYLPLLETEFDAINWLNSQYMSKAVLEKLIGVSGLSKLKKRVLIFEASNQIVKIHDIIFLCIQKVADKTKIYEKEFLDFYRDCFLIKNAQYYHALHLHREKILEIIKGEMSPGIALYLYLDIWANDEYGLISNISIDKYLREDYLYNKFELVDLYSVIQLIECLYKQYKGRNWEDKKKFAREQIDEFSKILSIDNLPEQFIKFTMHHLGKLYGFLEDDAAVQIFEDILELDSDMSESKLQLAKLYIKKEDTRQEGVDLFCDIIDEYFGGKPCGMTILLAAYIELCKINDTNLIEKYFIDGFANFSKVLQATVLERFDQPYKVLASVSKVFSYNHPQLLSQLAESIPLPSSENIDKKDCFAIAQTYKECGKGILWEENSIDCQEKAMLYFEQAETFYMKAPDKRPFERTMHAENLNKLKQYDKALCLLEKDDINWDEKSLPYKEYRHAEALFGLGQEHLDNALYHIERAIEVVKDIRYIAAFEELKACILYNIDPKQEEWKRSFERAIGHADSAKYKATLRIKYNEHLQNIS